MAQGHILQGAAPMCIISSIPFRSCVPSTHMWDHVQITTLNSIMYVSWLSVTIKCIRFLRIIVLLILTSQEACPLRKTCYNQFCKKTLIQSKRLSLITTIMTVFTFWHWFDSCGVDKNIWSTFLYSLKLIMNRIQIQLDVKYNYYISGYITKLATTVDRIVMKIYLWGKKEVKMLKCHNPKMERLWNCLRIELFCLLVFWPHCKHNLLHFWLISFHFKT